MESSIVAPPLVRLGLWASDAQLPRGIHAIVRRFRPAVWCDLAFVVFLGIIALWRWEVIRSFPEPSGIDAGNWLAYGNSLIGSHSRSASLAYPPVVPAISVAFASIWGPLTGAQILAAIASLAPAVGSYVLMRRYLGARALLLAGLLAPAAATGEAAAWGGFPQLIGLGLLALLIWALDHFVEHPNLLWIGVSAVFLLLTLLSSDLVGAAALGISTTYLLIRTLLSRERPPFRLLIVGAGAGAIAIAIAAPVYLLLASGVFHTETSKTSGQALALTNLQAGLDNLFKDNSSLWYLALLLGLLSPLVLWIGRRTNLAAASAAILIPAVAAMFVLRENRFLYFLPVAVVVGIGAWWSQLNEPGHHLVWWEFRIARNRRAIISLDRLVIAAAALALVIQSVLGIRAYEVQVAWYAVLTPGIVQGLDDLNTLAPHDAKIAVGPGPGNAAVQGWPFGWWAEGLLDRRTYYTSRLDWLNFQNERDRAMVANQMFNSPGGVSTAVATARANGISYIFVVTDWPGYAKWMSSSLGGAHIAFENDSTIIIATQA